MISFAGIVVIACKSSTLNQAISASPAKGRPYRQPMERNFTDALWCKTNVIAQATTDQNYEAPHCFDFSYIRTESELFIGTPYWPGEPRFHVKETKCSGLVCYVRDFRGRELAVQFEDSEHMRVTRSWRGSSDGNPPIGLREGDLYEAMVWRYRSSKE